MKQIVDFFQGLFATNKWPARWHCGEWSDFLGWMYIISDGLIWLAYFLMPIIIINYFSKKQRGISFKKVYLLFAAFILLCGTTHFMDAMMFWVPMYRLNTLIRAATGIVSLFTVYQLVKILPEALRQRTSLELEREIVKRKDAERQLLEANARLDSFAAVASHDLQEPLRKIATFNSMVAESNNSTIDERSKDLLRKSVEATHRMQSMIKGVLSLSSMKTAVPLTNVSLNEAANIAWHDLELKAQQKNATLKMAQLPLVQGNLEYLSRMFLNLFSNSLKFSKADPIISVSGKIENDLVLFSITDNGIGMPEDATKDIFEPFVKLHATKKFEGTGLGLSICKKIVEAHHGRISVESKENVGTSFRVQLHKAED